MKILITGAGGQLAWELRRSAPAGYDIICLSRSQLDITDAQALQHCFIQTQPAAVINAAAYTAVDKAESEVDIAMDINGKGAGLLAHMCANYDSYLLHISTDFVFDGHANQPYLPTDNPNPLGVYGASKLAGEHAVASNMDHNWSILRTSWVYSVMGSNFVKTMLRLMREKDALNVVSDQIGTPTSAASLAHVCWKIIESKLAGIFHWSDAGVASWYDFACNIQTLGLQKGLLHRAIPIAPIRTVEYPTPAARPAFSVLDKSSLLAELPSLPVEHWQLPLSRMLDELARS